MLFAVFTFRKANMPWRRLGTHGNILTLGHHLAELYLEACCRPPGTQRNPDTEWDKQRTSSLPAVCSPTLKSTNPWYPELSYSFIPPLLKPTAGALACLSKASRKAVKHRYMDFHSLRTASPHCREVLGDTVACCTGTLSTGSLSTMAASKS